ncbi:crotonase/enoyl-CoA hydratase family protein [Candidatus Poriferisocius sp.]|uniref:crotonase/enoyl-CoA hydratase family protein n=1 Tax=Candidatus Poriferisocius sp. TaxID=3101276 RepID=UPI003B02754C
MSEQASPFVSYKLTGDVALVELDDGRVNVLSHEVIAALHAALDRAEHEARAVVVTGRPGKFSAGFDLKVMQAGPEEARDLFRAGMDLFLRQYEFPIPIVAACTGHALAAGAIWLMCCDVRVGADVQAKIGLNETAIGMVLPTSVVTLARDRLSPRHVHSSVLLARLYSPEAATDAGYLDWVVPAEELDEAAAAEAAGLAGNLSIKAFAATRRIIRGPVAKAARNMLDDDTKSFTVGLET